MVVLFGEPPKADGDKSSPFGDIDGDLMGSILDGAGEKTDDARLVEEAVNQNVGSFTPDIFMENIKSFQNAKRLYGDRLLRLLSGFDSDYLEQNLGIPEFRKELFEKIRERVQRLKSQGLIERDGTISEKGESLAMVIAYVEELDRLAPKGLQGDVVRKNVQHYGDRDDSRPYKFGDRFRDINIRDSVRVASRRKHESLGVDDLMVSPRRSKGSVVVVFGLDASASMRGEKLLMGKRAGIALAYKAIKSRDEVGVVVFSHKVREVVYSTRDIGEVLTALSGAHAMRETDYTVLFDKWSEVFPKKRGLTKHLVILTDALPTAGEEPERATIAKASELVNQGVTISLIGINLDAEGESFGKKIADVGGGRFYLVKNTKEIDAVVLQDYYETAKEA